MGPTERVLVVDDEPGDRALLGAILKRISVVYDEAADGAAAIEALRRREYGAVILDLAMPGINGIGVLNTLRGVQPAMLARTIVLTAGGTDLISRVNKDVFRVMAKPFALGDVTEAVRDCLRQESRIESTPDSYEWRSD